MYTYSFTFHELQFTVKYTAHIIILINGKHKYVLVPVTHRSTLITDFNDWFILSQVPHNTAATGRCGGQDVLYLSVPWHTTDVIRRQSFTSWCQRVAWVCQIPDVNLRITSSWCQQAWFKGVEVQSLDWPYSTKQRNKCQQIVTFFVNSSDTGSVQTKGLEHVYGKLTVVFRLTRPSHKRITLMALCAVQIGTKTTVLQSFSWRSWKSRRQPRSLLPTCILFIDYLFYFIIFI